MDKNLSEYISTYKAQLGMGDIKVAYERLIKYVMSIKAYFEKTYPHKYSFSNVAPGYLDFSYFSFYDDFLRSKKLRFGIVLNHRQMRFELWLMGQNAEIQSQYWALLRQSVWNINQPTMPRYSVLEIVLVEEPDFDNLDGLTAEIVKKAVLHGEEVEGYIIGKTGYAQGRKE